MQRSVKSRDELDVNTFSPLKFPGGGAEMCAKPLICQADGERSGRTHTMSQRTLEAKKSLNNKSLKDVLSSTFLRQECAPMGRREAEKTAEELRRRRERTERKRFLFVLKMLGVVPYL